MLSLFHDLQNPLFKKTRFDALQFLEGVRPALENFHHIGGALENQLQMIMKNAGSKGGTDQDALTPPSGGGSALSDNGGAHADASMNTPGTERDSILSAVRLFGTEDQTKQAVAILDHDWSKEAEKDPDSEAGRLSRMVTKELFHMHEMNAKTAFLLQNHIQTITFQEGSCQVKNVALLSARAFAFTKKEKKNVGKAGFAEGGTEYEMVGYDFKDEESYSKASIAAQLEVLYDVTQEFVVEKPAVAASPLASSLGKMAEKAKDDASDSSTADAKPLSESIKKTESLKTTIVSVATLEGWLKGGPDNELRWKLALHRPAFEFPGIEHSY
jgi:hypothetical protein